ncbi:MAG: PAS domain S-box protein [Candidatus Dormibacteraeota bacterium]|nr:PAS domain S-box protein [Candidatus Dormibacteraeota bacterium]
MAHDEASYQQLIEAITDYAIFLLDREGQVRTWNTGAQRIEGYTQAEIIGAHFSRFYPQEDVERGKPRLALEAARAEGHYEEEGWRVRKDGSRFWAEVVITPLRDDAGAIVGFAKVTRDQTERWHALEQTTRLSERERIARDLQVGVNKMLFDIGLRLQAIASTSTEGEVVRELENCIEELDRAITALRRYVFGLLSRSGGEPDPE